MNSITTKGIICVKDKLNIEYRLCQIEYILYEDETYKYIFTPNYNIIDLLDSSIFQGIPGLNLDVKKEKYIREKVEPTFISERVPSKNREDYYELLESVNMEYMNPIEYLIKTKKKYSGDRMYVIAFTDTKKITISDIEKKCNSFGLIKVILDNIAAGNEVLLTDEINISTKDIFKLLYYIYQKSFENLKVHQEIGINLAKAQGKYRGRKPIAIDKMLFLETLERVNNKELTAKQAAINMGISIDKFYRYKNELQN